MNVLLLKCFIAQNNILNRVMMVMYDQVVTKPARMSVT